MKTKSFIIALIIFGGLFSYIACHTQNIDDNAFKTIAIDYMRVDKMVMNWTEVDVQTVRLAPSYFLYQGHEKNQFYFTSRVNRLLLYLNGNYAVKVTFRNPMDALQGPDTVYINPFTKGIIGLDFKI